MPDKTKSKITPDPPIIELKINEKLIFLNHFTQQIVYALNIACLEKLKGTPDVNEINSFIIQLDSSQKIDESTKIAIVYINGKHIGNKPFVQNLIRSYNIAVINTLRNIPEDAQKYEIKFKKPN